MHLSRVDEKTYQEALFQSPSNRVNIPNTETKERSARAIYEGFRFNPLVIGSIFQTKLSYVPS